MLEINQALRLPRLMGTAIEMQGCLHLLTEESGIPRGGRGVRRSNGWKRRSGSASVSEAKTASQAAVVGSVESSCCGAEGAAGCYMFLLSRSPHPCQKHLLLEPFGSLLAVSLLEADTDTGKYTVWARAFALLAPFPCSVHRTPWGHPGCHLEILQSSLNALRTARCSPKPCLTEGENPLRYDHVCLPRSIGICRLHNHICHTYMNTHIHM